MSIEEDNDDDDDDDDDDELHQWGTKKRKPRPDWSSLGPARFQFLEE